MADMPIWRPRSVEDTIDAGVHPAVAALRRRDAAKVRTVEDAITTNKTVGPSRQKPTLDLGRVQSDPSYDPVNFFKQAKKLGVNPLDAVTKSKAPLRFAGEDEKKSKKKKKKDKKDKKKSKKGKKKSKKKKSSSSSSGSSSSSSSGEKGGKKRKAEPEDEWTMAMKQQKADREAREEKMREKKAQEANEIAQRQLAERMAGQNLQRRNSAAAHSNARCPMRPEVGAELDRLAEEAYASLRKCKPGVQKSAEPAQGGSI
eukprot:gnl/TRDRNA2_/TRDRNA2_192853_c0_seq1.p1 gnl/TRDRNA2_/TRDRNA2_192853_c0~~gnl/TRDRNA2_/TRDRNA2_192853_c0_seq1.p1  ORF type:complete len:258 (+),score=73.74 gnl/TRDRNA2_/TRDRNA2_192853_c0_seq1:58-831(+)